MNEMFLNIVTPCSRVQNLPMVARNVMEIPCGNRMWWVVVDSVFPVKIPARNAWEIPDEVMFIHDPASIVGHAQRNRALDSINEGHVYFLDDDTILHPDLWETVKNLDDYDFIHFNQVFKNGGRRIGGEVAVDRIDSGSAIVSRELIGETRWIVGRYNADGYFLTECFKKAKNPLYIDRDLSYYNYLR